VRVCVLGAARATRCANRTRLTGPPLTHPLPRLLSDAATRTTPWRTNVSSYWARAARLSKSSRRAPCESARCLLMSMWHLRVSACTCAQRHIRARIRTRINTCAHKHCLLHTRIIACTHRPCVHAHTGRVSTHTSAVCPRTHMHQYRFDPDTLQPTRGFRLHAERDAITFAQDPLHYLQVPVHAATGQGGVVRG